MWKIEEGAERALVAAGLQQGWVGRAACLPGPALLGRPRPSRRLLPPLPPQVDDAEWQRLAGVDLGSAESTAGLALPERWVVSALHRTVRESTAAHER